MHDLSDEVLCDRWEIRISRTPGENSSNMGSCSTAPRSRARPTHGRRELLALLQEPGGCGQNRSGETFDLARVVIDTTVQPKAVMFPTDAKLINRARERLVRLANQWGVDLRQSYRRVGKLARIKHQRYAHARQFKRANKALRKLKTYLGRVIRDVGRRIAGNDALEEAFARELTLARRVRDQNHGQRGPKVYSLHAPEVECIGKGKAHRPYEFGVKVSVVTPLHRSRGGQFIAHVAALPGNPYDGHTLATVIPAMQALVGILSSAPSPMLAIAANTRRPIISSGSLPQVRSAASRPRSNASSSWLKSANQLSSAISRPSTAWAAIISLTAPATPSTPYSPPSATTSAS